MSLLKSKFIKRLLHGLIVLVGAGLGVAATMGGLEIYRLLRPTETLTLIYPAMAYVLMAGLGALVFHFLSDRIIRVFADMNAAVERYMDKMSMAQLVSSSLGLIIGLLIAALLCQVLAFLGNSIFTTAASALLYVVLGITGFSVGRRRSNDVAMMFDKTMTRSARKKSRMADEAAAVKAKVLDASVLIDGRILEVRRLGFMEGELVVPCFVLDELRRVADSSDSARRQRGRRGLDVVQKLQERGNVRLDQTDYPELTETDMKLLRLARETEAVLVSGDVSLCKVARMSGMTVLNFNELFAALRPAVSAGDELTLQIVKDGKEAGQGVGYLPDGTMIVVEGGRAQMGKSVVVTVTSALQTSAGRMIFARMKDSTAEE